MKITPYSLLVLPASLALLTLQAIILSVSLAADDSEGTLTEAPESYLEQYLSPELLKMVFPEADTHGPLEGTPPSAAVFNEDQLLGYIFETYDLVQGVGFSKQPFHILVGMDLTGYIGGVRLVHHTEPIAILGRTDDDFHEYLSQFPGLDIRKGVSVVIEMHGSPLEGDKFPQRTTSKNAGEVVQVDAVSRTTTSSVVFSDAIVRAARLVARNRDLNLTGDLEFSHQLDVDQFSPLTWPEMIADGSLAHLSLTHGDVIQSFEQLQVEPPSDVRSWKEDQPYYDLYVALATPAGIGINLLDKVWYDQYRAGRSVNDVLLLILSSGEYSFRGESYGNEEIFQRIQLVQGETTIPLRTDQHKELPFIHAKQRPEFNEISLFFFTPDVEFDPTKPWRLELSMEGKTSSGGAGAATYTIPYQVPDRFVFKTAGNPVDNVALEPDLDGASSGINYLGVWENQKTQIFILLITLITLTAILLSQEMIARRRRLHQWVRVGFLTWILVWLGWYTGAQVTIIHILNIAQSLVSDFDWSFFLIEPLIFIISVFVAVGLFLWGRAIFCGWLCPFGALQELLNKLAKTLKIPQVTIPQAVQERLFAIKYIIFLGLLGLTFYSFDLAMAGTQVEPFKAAITFRFDAPWAAVTYALLLLGIGLFIERFYCRFVCPLGAGLSILGRVRMFDWLKRRVECGNPCKRCEQVCPVGAINVSGQIDMNECFYCLDCQVMYYDDHQCPPLVARRKRGEQIAGGGKSLEIPGT